MPNYFIFEMSSQHSDLRHLQATEGFLGLKLDILDKSKGIVPRYKTHLRNYLMGIGRSMARIHSSPYPNRIQNNLMKRSGQAMRDLTNPDNIEFDSAPGLFVSAKMNGPFYLRVQEKGMTIKARRRQFMTIPLPAALDSRGLPKKQKARDWPNTRVIKSKDGALLIVQEDGDDITPLYILLKKVTIPPRLRLRKSLEDTARYFTDSVMDDLYHYIASPDPPKVQNVAGDVAGKIVD